MSSRTELTDELKKDAKYAWDYVKNGIKKIGTYGLLTLALYGSSNTNTEKFNELKQVQQNLEQTQDKLLKKLSSRDNNTAYLGDFITPYIPQTAEQKIDEEYNNLTSGKLNTYVSLDVLMEKGGIIAEDVQNLFAKNPEKLSLLIPGQTNKSLAKAADRVKGENQGNCLLGAQKIFQNARLGGLLTGENPDWPAKLKGCPSNSACNAYVPLEKSGKFVTITLANKAYKKTSASKENKEMKDYCKTLPAGTIVITENVIPDNQSGRRYQDLRRQYGSGGKVHGHIAIKDNHGLYKEEGVATAPNFASYGENFKISLSKDISIPKEVVKELLKEKNNRLEQEKQSQAKQNRLIPLWQQNSGRA